MKGSTFKHLPLDFSCLNLEETSWSFNCLWLSSTTVFSRSTFSVYNNEAQRNSFTSQGEQNANLNQIRQQVKRSN